MTPLIDTADEIRKLMGALRLEGWTHAQIAEHMNVTQRTVYRWAKGDTGPRDTSALDQLRGLQEAQA